MILKEYGQTHSKTILFLHGGGLSWWNFREEAELLRHKYHILLPVLNGHRDSDTPFTTIETQAQQLIDYIDANHNGHVHAICGLSLGGQILLEVLAQRSDICSYAIIESALAIPMPITHALTDISLQLSYPLIEKPWFAKLQFKALGIKDSLFAEYYRDSCSIKKSDMIAFLKANSAYKPKTSLRNSHAKAMVIVGGKEQRKLKQSARLIQQLLSTCRLKTLDGYTHGELSLNHADQYVKLLEQFMEQ